MSSEKLLFLEDLQVGQRSVSRSYRVTAEEIKAFARQYDPQYFHLDEEEAKKSPLFRGLAASGWHTGSITMRLMVTGGLPFAWGQIGAGGDVSWPRPTRPGDELTVYCEILAIAPSRSKNDRGIVSVRAKRRTSTARCCRSST